jgi:hypothetical protein
MKVEIELSNEEAEDLRQRWPGHLTEDERITLLENRLAIRVRNALPTPAKIGDEVVVYLNGNEMWEAETLLFEDDNVFLTVDAGGDYTPWGKADGFTYVKAG